MNETSPGESVVLGIVLAGCVWYIYRSLKRMFSVDVPKGGCGGKCSGHSECGAEDGRQRREDRERKAEGQS